MKRSGEIQRHTPFGTDRHGLLGAPAGWLPTFSTKKVRQRHGRKMRWMLAQEARLKKMHTELPIQTLAPARPVGFVDRVKRFMRKLFRWANRLDG
jgi:hypothetical protein